MKHRTLALLMAAAMLIALPACGGNDGDGGDGPAADSPAVTDPAEPDASPSGSEPVQSAEPSNSPDGDPTEPVDTPEPDGADEPSDSPSPSPSQSASPSPSPSQSASPSPSPSQSPAPSPSQSAAPSQTPAPEPSPEPEPEPSESASVDLQAFYESLCANENFGANMSIEGDFLTMYYPGMSDIATRQQVIYTPMISSVVCEIALVEVENASDVQAVKNIFQARIDSQVGTDENPGLACYPESIRGWQEDSRIVSNGNYVMMIAWWDYCDSAVTAFNALF